MNDVPRFQCSTGGYRGFAHGYIPDPVALILNDPSAPLHDRACHSTAMLQPAVRGIHYSVNFTLGKVL